MVVEGETADSGMSASIIGHDDFKPRLMSGNEQESHYVHSMLCYANL